MTKSPIEEMKEYVAHFLDFKARNLSSPFDYHTAIEDVIDHLHATGRLSLWKTDTPPKDGTVFIADDEYDELYRAKYFPDHYSGQPKFCEHTDDDNELIIKRWMPLPKQENGDE